MRWETESMAESEASIDSHHRTSGRTFREERGNNNWRTNPAVVHGNVRTNQPGPSGFIPRPSGFQPTHQPRFTPGIRPPVGHQLRFPPIQPVFTPHLHSLSNVRQANHGTVQSYGSWNPLGNRTNAVHQPARGHVVRRNSPLQLVIKKSEDDEGEPVTVEDRKVISMFFLDI